MVDEKRAKRKLPALLVDVPVTAPHGSAEYAKKDRGLRKLRRHDPRKFGTLFGNYIRSLEAFDQAITAQEKADIDNFNRRFRKR